jgi:hypothetical protein
MSRMVWEVQAWAEAEFGGCRLGDRRRNRRLVKLAARIAADPSATTPDQMQWWADTKGAYRFMDNDDVCFEEIIEPHCQATRSIATSSGHSLIIHDTTELSYATWNQPREDLGPTGNGRKQGFYLHSALRIDAHTQEILGLAGQILFARVPAPKPVDKKRETALDAKRRPRESEIWQKLMAMVGRPPAGEHFTHVCDRGADNFEVYAQAHLLQTDWIVRSAHLHRKVRLASLQDPENPRANTTTSVDNLLVGLPFQGTSQVAVVARPGRRPRIAQVQLRWASVWMPRPTPCSQWAQEQAPAWLRMQVLEVIETDPPARLKAVLKKGTRTQNSDQPLRWVLYTSHAITSLDDAQAITAMYTRRPLIEEYHKALKTGCQVEERQYQTGARLARITGVLSVTAIRLLRMKSVAAIEPERPADDVAPTEWVEALYDHRTAESPKYRERWPHGSWTIQEFLRQLAMLGGFLGRKHDGSPGWLTLWRGTTKLQLILQTRRAMRRKCG